jgi:hypothetical protein
LQVWNSTLRFVALGDNNGQLTMKKSAKKPKQATGAELRKALKSAEVRHKEAKGRVRDAKAAAKEVKRYVKRLRKEVALLGSSRSANAPTKPSKVTASKPTKKNQAGPQKRAGGPAQTKAKAVRTVRRKGREPSIPGQQQTSQFEAAAEPISVAESGPAAGGPSAD